MVLGGELLFVAGLVFVVLALIRFKAGTPWYVAALWVGVGVYSLAAVDRLFLPLVVDPALRSDILTFGGRVNLVPFKTVGELLGRESSTQAVRQIGGNLGLLLPLGAVLPVLAPRLRSASALALGALAATLCIETLQFAATRAGLISRAFDVDDVVLNLAGALLGWLVWKMASRALTHRRMGTRMRG